MGNNLEPTGGPRGDRRRAICLWCAALVAVFAALVLYAFAIWFGAVNQDEGWYLYAARSVAEGKMPFRDFFFTQGPLLPYVYRLFLPLWSPHGLLGGRIVTAVLGLLSCLLTAALASRAVHPGRAAEAGIAAFGLTAGNLYHAYFTTLPKTYALSAFLLTAGFAALTFCVPRLSKTRRFLSSLWGIPAGILIALSAGARLSMGLLLPVTALALLLSFKKTGSAFFWFSIGGALGLALVYGPPLLEARDAFVFSQTFHVSRGGRDLFLMAGSVARSVRGYLPLAVLGAALFLFRIFRPEDRGPGGSAAAVGGIAEPAGRGGLWPWIWLAGAGAVFALHLFSPHPYDDYQVPVMTLFAAACVVWLMNAVDSAVVRARLCLLCVAASLLASLGSPLAQDWFVKKIDRFWVIMKEKPDLAQLREEAREIRHLSGSDGILLTQDLYLAVEAGMKVPEGLEMGPFSYFPELSDADAAKYHVLNKEGLLSLLARAPARVAAYSGYGWAIRSPKMDRVPDADRRRFLSLLGRNYESVRETPDFGQNKTTLVLLIRRQPVPTPAEAR